MSPVAAAAQHARAIDAIGELLGRLQIDFMFVGSVARAAWLGDAIESGSIDVVAVMQPQQKSQVATMASNRGFAIEPARVDASEELDLIPMSHDGIRVHVLVATNALYARMVKDAWSERIGEHDWRVPSREDLAILLALSDDDDGMRRLIEMPDFDRAAYNDKVTSIGLRGLAL